MKRRWGWLIAALLGLGIAMTGPARAQVVINGVNEGLSYTVPSTGVSALAESIGDLGGTLLQSQAQNNVSGALDIGLGSSVFPYSVGAGTYNLSGGSVVAEIEQLGLGNGIGTFDQLNGTNTVGTLSLLGQTAANGLLHGQGTYTLGGGTLIANTISVGDGTATDRGLFQFTGGTADFSQMQINLGGTVTASGAEVLDAANPTNTTRSITQSGGSNTVTGVFELGAAGTTTTTNGVVTGYAPNNDTYALSGGTLTAGSESLGLGGNATFTQAGGANTVQSGGELLIGSAGYLAAPGIGGGGVATYTLSQGTLTAPQIGVAASGTLAFNGGAADFGQLTSLGTLSASGNEVLDQAGAVNSTYRVFQEAGSNAIGGALEVGASGTTGSTGTFTANAGTYNLESTSQLGAGAEVFGLAGTGSMVQISGTNTIAPLNAASVTLSDGSTVTAGTLMLGDDAGSSGSYEMTGNGGALLTADTEIVGNNGTGSFTQLIGSNSTGTLTIALGAGSGSYTLLGGTLTARVIHVADTGSMQLNGGVLDFGQLSSLGTLSATGNEVLDSTGATNPSYHVYQEGGTNTVGGALEVGASGANTGVYNLDLLSKLSAGGEVIGLAGTGTVTQTSGTNAIATTGTSSITLSDGSTLAAGTLMLGDTIPGTGTYQLEGPASQLSAGSEVVGNNGSGTFDQIAGTNTTGSLTLAQGVGNGSYTLSGGSLHAGTIDIGANGVMQLGAGTLDFGQMTLAGSLNAGNGNEVLDSAGQTHASYAVTQTGGSNTAGIGALELGAAAGNTGSYTLSGGSMSFAAEVIGLAGTGSFIQTGGSNTLTGAVGVPVLLSNGTAVSQDTLTVGLAAGSTGTYSLQGGTLAGNVAVSSYGTFNLSGGSLAGGIINNGLFTETGPGSTGALTNNATAWVFGPLTASQVTNAGLFTLSGGTVSTSTGFINTSTLSGSGTISGTGAFVNSNLFTQSGGSFTLAATGANDNTGEIDLATGTTTPFQIATGSTLANDGLIKLNGGTLSGGGILDNSSGLIGGTGRIATARFDNQGTLTADAGLTSLSGLVINSGIVQLTSTGALLTGSPIDNTGTIEGVGRINNSIADRGGTIQALGGTLTLGGPVSTVAQTTLIAGAGGQLLLSGAFTDVGTISLAGGNFDDASGQALINSGTISGYGSFTATALNNSRTILVAGGTGTFNGTVVNNAGGTITVDHAAAVFNGPVTNDGTIHTHFGTASYAGTFTNNGTVISDPSTQTFTGDLVEGSTGVIQAAAGDRYVVEGGFLNHSTQNATWNTTGATLELAAGGTSSTHNLLLAGSDLGATAAGYQNNFAWGNLAIDAGQFLALGDGVTGSNVAFYADIVSGAVIGSGGISNITGNGYNIYYDPLYAGNAYLGGLTYSLAGGGRLIADSVPTPEPASLGLLATGLLGAFAVRRRRLSGAGARG